MVCLDDVDIAMGLLQKETVRLLERVSVKVTPQSKRTVVKADGKGKTRCAVL
jgi:hypothetical protein